MKKLSLKASCLCGGIQFKTKGYHRNVQNCHCVQCVKTHGNYAAYTYVEEKNIKFLKNLLKLAMLMHQKIGMNGIALLIQWNLMVTR